MDRSDIKRYPLIDFSFEKKSATHCTISTIEKKISTNITSIYLDGHLHEHVQLHLRFEKGDCICRVHRAASSRVPAALLQLPLIIIAMIIIGGAGCRSRGTITRMISNPLVFTARWGGWILINARVSTSGKRNGTADFPRPWARAFFGLCCRAGRVGALNGESDAIADRWYNSKFYLPPRPSNLFWKCSTCPINGRTDACLKNFKIESQGIFIIIWSN